MTDWLSLSQKYQAELFDLIERLVLIETPTRDKSANDRASTYVAELVSALGGTVTVHRQDEFGDHISADWAGNSSQPTGLVVGHLDTVWPLGPLERMGYFEENGRLFGPGVLDMKAGISTTIVGLTALRLNNLWPDRPIKVLFNTDEEVGSPSSRRLVEEYATGAAYALIMEIIGNQ